jgi:hypothetical protein
MAVTHSTAARNAATDAVTALLGSLGTLKFRITGSTVAAPSTIVANLTLAATAFGASATGTATANAIGSDTNATGGTVAFASLQTSTSTLVIHCAVAASGSDINMTNGLIVTAGDTVSCSSLTYTALSA